MKLSYTPPNIFEEVRSYQFLNCKDNLYSNRNSGSLLLIKIACWAYRYEARAAERATAKAKAEEEALKEAAISEELSRSLSGVSVRAHPPGAKAETAAAAKSLKSADDDADLDAYLMGALGSDDEAGGIP